MNRNEMTLSEADAWRAGAAAMRERAAQCVDCGCPPDRKAAAADAHFNGGRRWMACGENNCGAIEAAAIRATDLPEPPR